MRRAIGQRPRCRYRCPTAYAPWPLYSSVLPTKALCSKSEELPEHSERPYKSTGIYQSGCELAVDSEISLEVQIAGIILKCRNPSLRRAWLQAGRESPAAQLRCITLYHTGWRSGTGPICLFLRPCSAQLGGGVICAAALHIFSTEQGHEHGQGACLSV